MIHIKVQEVARSKGITNIKAFAEKAGLAYDTAADFWHGRMKRIDLGTFERVCRTLGVQPADLMVMTDQ